MFLANFLNEHTAGNPNVITCLNDVHAIIHVLKALSCYRDGELIVNLVEKNVCCPLVRDRDGKVVNLPFEDDFLSLNGT